MRESRTWPALVGSGAVVLASLSFLAWTIVHSSNTPRETTVTVTQGDATSTPSAEELSLNEVRTRECDKQVAIFMNTHDIVELERARQVISWFNCAVTRRLRDMPRR